MPAIHYLTELDKKKLKEELTPIIYDMPHHQIFFALIFILDGMDIKEAIDRANLIPKMRYK